MDKQIKVSNSLRTQSRIQLIAGHVVHLIFDSIKVRVFFEKHIEN